MNQSSFKFFEEKLKKHKKEKNYKNFASIFLIKLNKKHA